MTPTNERIEQAIEAIQAKVHGYPRKEEETEFLRQILSALVEEVERETWRKATATFDRVWSENMSARPPSGPMSEPIDDPRD